MPAFSNWFEFVTTEVAADGKMIVAFEPMGPTSVDSFVLRLEDSEGRSFVWPGHEIQWFCRLGQREFSLQPALGQELFRLPTLEASQRLEIIVSLQTASGLWLLLPPEVVEKSRKRDSAYRYIHIFRARITFTEGDPQSLCELRKRLK